MCEPSSASSRVGRMIDTERLEYMQVVPPMTCRDCEIRIQSAMTAELLLEISEVRPLRRLRPSEHVRFDHDIERVSSLLEHFCSLHIGKARDCSNLPTDRIIARLFPGLDPRPLAFAIRLEVSETRYGCCRSGADSLRGCLLLCDIPARICSAVGAAHRPPARRTRGMRRAMSRKRA